MVGRILLLGGLLLQSPFSLAKDVLVVLSQDGPIYQSVLQAIKEQLANDDAIVLDVVPVATALSRQQEPDLVVSVGAAAMTYSRKRWPGTDQINSFITRPAYQRAPVLVGDDGEVPPRLGAVFLDQPIQRQLHLAQLLSPKGRLALLLPPQARGWVIEYQLHHPQEFKRFNIAYTSGDENVVDIARELLRDSELLIAVPEPAIWQPANAKWLLYVAYQLRKPVVGFSAALTRAGALVSVYSTPQQIGRQTGENIRRWKQGDESWATGQPPLYYSLEVNQAVAESLGIDQAIVRQLQDKQAATQLGGLP